MTHRMFLSHRSKVNVTQENFKTTSVLCVFTNLLIIMQTKISTLKTFFTSLHYRTERKDILMA